MRLQAVKGTQDILPRDQAAWLSVSATAKEVLEAAGAGALTTPIFEHTEVFEKSVGDSADLVVQKEMYTFEDRGGRSLTLRPEFTAGVMRAFIEHGMHTLPRPVKLWSQGPLFRAENVQRGRQRQFHQVNFESIGLDGPLADAEAIELLYRTLRRCGLTRHRIKLGSVGDPEDRQAYNAYLRAALSDRAHELSPVSQERLRLNPMRVLDSKDANDQRLIADLQRPLDRLGAEARAHLAKVEEYLTSWGVPFDLEPAIVRGLDYYRRTAFEAHYEGIGAQSALGGGGRYDGLIEMLGGPALPGTGWAFGVERVLDALAQEPDREAAAAPRPDLFVVPLDDAAVDEAAALAMSLRRAGRWVEFAYQRRNPGKGLRDADRSRARFAAVRGAEERHRRAWQLKDLASGAQLEVAEADLAAALEERLSQGA
ncbi:MAG: histidine--tRNA ligase [Trueperaceae bacterium]|nr:histidine--tRNA ligase [Trueperaceae bacterium]MCO5174457.1 histidine--tRNA ligase [Trueperaceae bacterium]MCW5819836.1 histidine--tRNA ligase [Trueperaceae bacterium]